MLFSDSKFNELDDLTKIVEPFESMESEIIALVPDELDISEYVANNITHYYSSPYAPDVRSVLALVLKDKIKLVNNSLTERLFKYDILMDDGQQQLILDMTTKKMNGKIFLKKKSPYTDDMIRDDILGGIKSTFHRTREYMQADKAKVNEVANMFGIEHEKLKGLKTSPRDKVAIFGDLLVQKFNCDEYKVRNLEMSQKINHWIKRYFHNDHCSNNCIFNITQIAIMISNKMPIYSLDEEREVE